MLRSSMAIAGSPARNDDRRRAAIELDLRQLARQELEPRLRELAAQHDPRPGRVSIRNQRSRWGSWRGREHRAQFPSGADATRNPHDYVLLHELMHLRAAESLSTLLAARRAGPARDSRGRAMVARPGKVLF